MGVKITGFDNFEKELKKLSSNASRLEGKRDVSFDVLFDDSFMRKHTSVGSFTQFLEIGGFIVNSPEDFKNIPDAIFDVHVQKETSFKSWNAMLEEATGEYVAKELGFKK